MDKSTAVYIHAYDSKSRAKKEMLEYLRNHYGYDGQDNVVEVRNWVTEHSKTLKVEICPMKM
ncbi:MAG: hypothetical protein GWN00_06600, partial [Aliifodinibius sp.]|nr:hypothetical protein [Fodinibius sp.]NIX00764.1 hypothetical protein [Phycisphaerae bacterium]NIY24486.1 hypothetical protein [Fodinibius sp.]